MSDLPLFDPHKALAEIRQEAARRNSLPQKLPQELPQPHAGVVRKQDQRLNATSATSAGSAGAPHEHDASRTRVNKEKEKKNIIISNTYARGWGDDSGPATCGTVGPAEVAEPAEVELSLSEQTISLKNGSAEVFADGLRKWRSALSAMSLDRVPCPGYRGTEWARTLARAVDFLDLFGPQAEALGWTAPRLFGVHPVAGIVRVDACGALVLPGSGTVRAITATEVSFGGLTHRQKPGQPQGVPWWEFGR